MKGPRMREVLLHGGPDDAFDRSVVFARQLAETFGARLHILYAVEDPLAAGWTAEITPARLPEIHAAIEDEARERLARSISLEDQERLGIQLVIRTGPEQREVVLYTTEHPIDLAIVHAHFGNEAHAALAHALIEQGRCAVLVLR